MAFCVYILQCSDGSHYTGHTDDLQKRLAAHQKGEISGYTSKHRPVQVVFTEEFTSQDEAFRSERKIKGWTRRKKEALIRRDWNCLVELSEGSRSPRSYGSTGSP
ncbi:MAG: GIY-YIG nuclease family protein [Chloroflexi bacterium]|nr:GIY-YIG nuclease family protein [Chloroflexota bacterium]